MCSQWIKSLIFIFYINLNCIILLVGNDTVFLQAIIHFHHNKHSLKKMVEDSKHDESPSTGLTPTLISHLVTWLFTHLSSSSERKEKRGLNYMLYSKIQTVIRKLSLYAIFTNASYIFLNWLYMGSLSDHWATYSLHLCKHVLEQFARCETNVSKEMPIFILMQTSAKVTPVHLRQPVPPRQLACARFFCSVLLLSWVALKIPYSWLVRLNLSLLSEPELNASHVLFVQGISTLSLSASHLGFDLSIKQSKLLENSLCQKH